MRAAISHDGENWQNVEPVETQFPAKVQVGVVALNGSGDEFSATFSDWTVTQP